MESDAHLLPFLLIAGCHALALAWCAVDWRRNLRLAVAAGLAVGLIAPLSVNYWVERARVQAEWREIEARIESGELKGPEFPNPVVETGPRSTWDKVQDTIGFVGAMAWLASLVLVAHELVVMRPVRAAPVVVAGTLLLRIVFGLVVSGG